MTEPLQKPVWYRQIRWRLTLSYSVVLFFTIVIAEFLFVAGFAAYAHYKNPSVDTLDFYLLKMQQLLEDDLLIIPVCLAVGHLISRGFSQRLENLVLAADAWARGLFYVRPTDESPDEIGMLTRRLQIMAAQLQKNIETEQELAAARERDRIARDLHDTVKQQVFAIGMEMTAVRNLLTADPAAAAQMLDDAIGQTRQVQRDLNSLIERAPPAGLDHKTLGMALREFVDRMGRFGIDVSVHVTGDRDLPIEVEEPLFRTIQGALSNVAKHSQANIASVDLEGSETGILLRVADDGIGFDPFGPSMSGFGLASMRTRIAEIGGTLEIDSQPGTGTVLTVQVPVPPHG